MPHRNLKDLGFTKEYIISENKEDNFNFIKRVPRESGIYVILSDKNIQRLKDQSNIVYIGESDTLCDRLRNLFMYLLPHDSFNQFGPHTARKAMMKILEETDLKLSISYIKKDNPRELESKLIVAYCNSHIEPPPLNNQRK